MGRVKLNHKNILRYESAKNAIGGWFTGRDICPA